MEAKTSDRIAGELFNTLLVKKLEYKDGSAKTAEFLDTKGVDHRGTNSPNSVRPITSLELTSASHLRKRARAKRPGARREDA